MAFEVCIPRARCRARQDDFIGVGCSPMRFRQVHPSIRSNFVRAGRAASLIAAPWLVETSGAAPEGGASAAPRLSLKERVSCAHTIEELYGETRNSRPSGDDGERLEDRARAEALETTVGSEILHSRSEALPTGAEIQAELDRMGRSTRRPAMLEEIFDALDRDPLLAAECLA